MLQRRPTFRPEEPTHLADNPLTCEVVCARASNEASAGHGPSPAREGAFVESW